MRAIKAIAGTLKEKGVCHERSAEPRELVWGSVFEILLTTNFTVEEALDFVNRKYGDIDTVTIFDLGEDFMVMFYF